ncbi:MAG: hypothetical protein FGM55_08840 [Rhodoferax sp.]|nr:hypothetical protein [Rhodoferax sp.]
MKTLAYLTPAGTEFWLKSSAGWEPSEVPQGGPVWMVTDLAEESLSDIQVPRLFGRDRSGYIQRQLASKYPESPYRMALPPPAGGTLMARLAPPRQTLLGLDAAGRIDELLDELAIPIAGLWTTSQLLSSIATHRSVPADSFVVLPHADRLRILFFKQRVPIISRLVRDATTPGAQVAEIVRTLRHLENTKVLDRDGKRHSVVVLGGGQGMQEALSKESLMMVAAPRPWRDLQPEGLKYQLFDLALRSPPGQLLPLKRRTGYVAIQVRRIAYALGVAALTFGGWQALNVWQDLDNSQSALARVQADTRKHSGELAGVDRDLKAYGVSADLVRRVIQMDQTEIISAPSMSAHLWSLARAIGSDPGLRLVELDWSVVTPGSPVCDSPATGDAAATTGAEAATGDPGMFSRVSFSVRIPSGRSSKARSQAIIDLTDRLRSTPGVKVLTDPMRGLAEASLSGSLSKEGANSALSWCLAVGRPTLKAPEPAASAPRS